MKQWYYQIKAKQDSDCDYSRWIWPPVFSGMVEAEDRKQARAKIDDEYQHKFPMRVLKKDVESATFLMKITEITENNHRTKELFELKLCKVCNQNFRVIDHYNDDCQQYKGRDYCSDGCKDDYTKEHDTRIFSDASYSNPPVIYRITNTITRMTYVGQTSQAFTLRWWQHFAHGTDTKFHKAIKESNIENWVFSVIEVIDFANKEDQQSKSDYICSREQFYINVHNSIKNGYNTATAKKEPEKLPLFEED